MGLINGQVGGTGSSTVVGVPGEGATIEIKQTPAPVLGGKSVKVTEMSEMERLVLESQYKTAKHTIDNMVDTPEERKAKELRARERRKEGDEKDMIDKELVDKEVEIRAMNDEITSERKEPV